MNKFIQSCTLIAATLFLTPHLFAQVPIPTISSFAPASGPIGTAVTISGTNFSTTAANNIVFFGAVKAAVTNATATSLVVTVPMGATYQPITVTTNKLTAYSAKPFVVTFSGGLGINNRTFAYNNNLSTAFSWSFNFCDLDGDGKPDIVCNDDISTSNQLQDSLFPVFVYRNESTSGNILFGNRIQVANSALETYLATGDLDGDGKQDIIFTSGSSNYDSFCVAKNTSTPGSISFANPISFKNAALYPAIFAVGDLNDDGKPDVVVGTNGDVDSLSVYQNNTPAGGNISLVKSLILLTNENPFAILIGDIDGDGKPDIILGDGTNNSDSLLIFKNTSTAGVLSFAAETKYFLGGIGGPEQPSLALGDIDGDGKLDIVSTADTLINFQSAIAVFRNTSTPGVISFAPQANFATSCDQGSVAINDLDGDGKPDIVFQNCNDVAVLKNNSTVGNMALGPEVDFNGYGSVYGTIAAADLDGDGKPDIGVSDNGFSLYLNTPFICIAPSTVNTTLPAPLSLEWLHTYGGKGDDEAAAITAVSDTTFIATGVLNLNSIIDSSETDQDEDIYDSADAYIAKYSTNGNLLWQKTFAGNKEDEIYSVIKAANGGFITIGSTRSNTGAFAGNHGGFDTWVTKLDSTGNIVWQKLFGGSGNEFRARGRKTADGNYIILAGTTSTNGDVVSTVPVDEDSTTGNPWLFKINESGTILWQKVFADTLDFYDIQTTADKGFILLGDASDDSTFDHAIVTKTDSAGNISFTKEIDSLDQDQFDNIVVNADSSYTFTGYTEASGDNCTGEHGALGNFEIAVGKLDKNTNLLWRKYFGGSNDEQAEGGVDNLLRTNDGGNLILGYTYSNDGNVTNSHDSVVNGSQGTNGDGWMFKLDANGNLQWQKTIGGNGDDFLSGAIQLTNNDYIGIGTSNTQNNGDIFGGAGSYDVIVFRIGGGLSLCPSADTAITSNLTGTAYQWQVNTGSGYTNISNNANYSGATTNTLHIMTAPTAFYGYQYRCVVTGAGNSETIVLKFSEQWTGAVSNAWETAANWSCGKVPDANTDVTINNGTVVLSSNQSVRSLTVYSGVNFTVKTPFKLTLMGK